MNVKIFGYLKFLFNEKKVVITDWRTGEKKEIPVSSYWEVCDIIAKEENKHFHTPAL